jgi:tetratricopeptide (TPR) repeat protein
MLLVAAIFIAYQPVWRAGFIWDDDVHLTANPCIVGPLGFLAIWTSSAAFYYPLALTTFWLEHASWGLNPIPYHLVNIAMHAACAILLWRVLLSLDVPGAWLGAALWALHPVMVESAAWITELKNTQSCFFYLLAILFFVKWWKTSAYSAAPAGGRYYALALLCGTLAILSKSSTVMLPVVLGLCAWWLGARWSWRIAARLSPFLFISLVASGWTVWEQKYHSGALGTDWQQSWPERIVIAGKAIWFYLGKLAWPHPLIFIYPRWKIDPSQPLEWLPAAAVAAALFFLWRERSGRMRPLFFAAAYFVVSLFPVLGFFSVYFFRYSFVGDHFQYLASMSPLALAAAGMERLREQSMKCHPLAVPCLSALLLGALGVLTWRQSATYRDMETLWGTTIARNPGSWMAHDNLGVARFHQGRTWEAIAQYRQALDIDPAQAEPHSNLGDALFQQGRTGDALAQCIEALRIDPANANAHNNLGRVLDKEGRTAEAVAQYREALRINPALAEACNNLGAVLCRQGRTEEAISQYRAALRLNPAFAEAHCNLGIALQKEGLAQDALAEYRTALRIDPAFAGTHFNLGILLLQQGNPQEAISEFREALRTDPASVDAHNNLGIGLFQEGHTEQAISEFREGLRIDPTNPDAHSNLGVALLQEEQAGEAIAEFRKALELRPANPAMQNRLAWALATAAQISLRDGARAVQLAAQASQATGANNADILRTLAAAYAQEGQYPEAVETAQKALGLAQTASDAALAGALRREIRFYQAGQPYPPEPQ